MKSLICLILSFMTIIGLILIGSPLYPFIDAQSLLLVLGLSLLMVVARHQRSDSVVEVAQTLTLAGPISGAISSLIGIVLMLLKISQPSEIGPAMAVVVLSVLYGSLIGLVGLIFQGKPKSTFTPTLMLSMVLPFGSVVILRISYL